MSFLHDQVFKTSAICSVLLQMKQCPPREAAWLFGNRRGSKVVLWRKGSSRLGLWDRFQGRLGGWVRLSTRRVVDEILVNLLGGNLVLAFSCQQASCQVSNKTYGVFLKSDSQGINSVLQGDRVLVITQCQNLVLQLPSSFLFFFFFYPSFGCGFNKLIVLSGASFCPLLKRNGLRNVYKIYEKLCCSHQHM